MPATPPTAPLRVVEWATGKILHEAVTQLRGDAGPRQVPDARTAVVTSGGGTPSGVLLLQGPT